MDPLEFADGKKREDVKSIPMEKEIAKQTELKEKDCMECKFFKFADKTTKYIQKNLK